MIQGAIDLFLDSSFSDILTLKSLQDRTFGCGALEDSGKMLFMNSEVLMEVEIDIEKIAIFNAEYVSLAQ